MADYSTEELEKIADKFRSDTSGIRGTKDFTSPEELYDELKKEIKKYHPSDDTSLVDKAYRVAYDAHKGQARKSGEPYIIHPLCVAIILAELELDKETIAAGLLHDVLEDTIMTMDEMRAEFGDASSHRICSARSRPRTPSPTSWGWTWNSTCVCANAASANGRA